MSDSYCMYVDIQIDLFSLDFYLSQFEQFYTSFDLFDYLWF